MNQINHCAIPAELNGCSGKEGCGGSYLNANSAKELPCFTWEKEFQPYSNRSAQKAPFHTYAVLAIMTAVLSY